jgi:two-component system CheB/CheR fusion protein
MLQLSRSAVLEPYRTQRISQSGASMDVWITSTALMDEDGQMYAISTTERNQVESVS